MRRITITSLALAVACLLQPGVFGQDENRPQRGRPGAERRGPERDGERGERPEGRRFGGPGERGPRDGSGPGAGGPFGGRSFGGPGAGGPPEGRPNFNLMAMNPVIAALDSNEDGVISADEISNAAAALKSLDKNEDGELTRNELFSPSPQGDRPGPGGPDGDQRRGGFGRMQREIGPDGPPRGDRPEMERGPREGGPEGRGPRGPQGPGAEGMMSRLMQLDSNDDGKISKEEAPERMGPMFDRIDTNSDGLLDKAELEQMASRFRGPGAGESRPGPGEGRPPRDGDRSERGAPSGDMQARIDRLMQLDKNDDGKISKEEAPERMGQMFDRIDTNSDGQLDKAELKAMAERFSGRRPGPGGPSRDGGPGRDGGRGGRAERPGRDGDA